MTDPREPFLFKKFPALRGRMPWMALGTFPTPVAKMEKLGARLGHENLYLKKDDLSGVVYGGNKVRKLEFALADVKARGRGPIITLGAVGSNHVLATTIYGRVAGLSTIGVFVPQPVQENLRVNLLGNCAQGCRIEYVRSNLGAAAKIAGLYLGEWKRSRRRPYLLGPGGSSILGIIGYVEAAFELAAQVEEGILPAPDFIFTPVGSGGTFAGLVLGLKLAGLPSKAVGVRVYDRITANETVTAFYANRTLRYLRRLDPTIPDPQVRSGDVFMLHDYFGAGYSHYTRKGVAAVKLAAELEGLKLEGTYSGKAMAAFIDFMGDPARRNHLGLFINTYNSRPLEPLLQDCPGYQALPSALHEYFQKDIAPVDG